MTRILRPGAQRSRVFDSASWREESGAAQARRRAHDRAQQEEERARLRAEEIVAEARAEAEAIRTCARDEGRTEGLEEALGAAARQIDAFAQAAGDDRWLECVLAAGEALAVKRLMNDPKALRDLLAAATARLQESATLVVEMSPATAEAIGPLEGWAVVEDATLADGDLVLTSDLGRVDGRRSVRLSTLRRAAHSENP